MLKLLLPVLFCCFFFSGTAQRVQLTGRVLDAMDEESPLAFATVHRVGKNTGTITDLSGNFSLVADEDDLIRFSYAGYETMELSALEVKELNGQVALNVRQLKEVVISARKVDITPCTVTCICTYLGYRNDGLEQETHGAHSDAFDCPATWAYFPNPTKGSVQVETSLEGRIKVFSVDQKLMSTQKITDKHTVVELNGQVPGVYFLVFENDDFSKTIGQVVLTD